MKLFLTLAYKFLFPRGRRRKFYTFSKLFTISSIAIALASFLIVLSVFRAYIDTLASRYKAVYSDLIVTNTTPEYDDIKEVLQREYSKQIEHVANTGYMEVLLSERGKIKGIALEFVSEEFFIKSLKPFLIEGELSCLFSGKNIIITKTLLEYFNLNLGDSIELIFVGKNTRSHSSYYKICAVVNFGVYNLDSRFSYISKGELERDFPSGIYNASVKIKLKNDVNLDDFTKKLRDNYAPHYIIKTWKDINYGTIESANFDKFVVSIILAILIAIAVFNVSVTLILSVKYSREDLAILWILGMRAKDIRKIVVLEGLLISAISVILSFIIWFLVYIILEDFWFMNLPYNVYMLHSIPLELSVEDFALGTFFTVLFVLFISYLVSRLWRKNRVLNAFRS